MLDTVDLAQAEGRGNISHAGITLLVHQFLDSLQVVFGGF